MDQFSLEEAIDRLGERIVIVVSDAADRRFDASIQQALGVANADILNPAIGMMYQAAAALRAPLAESLFESVEHKGGVRRARNAPAHDAAGKRVDNEGDIGKALPGRDIREIRDPQRIRRCCPELPVDPAERAWRRRIADRGPHRPAAHRTCQAQLSHQPGDPAAWRRDPFAPQLPPNLAHAIDPEVRLPDPPDVRAECCIAAGAGRLLRRIDPTCRMGVVGGWAIASTRQIGSTPWVAR